MSNLTKYAIIENTMELAALTPLNKITVRNITDRCGITRNAFYYHFHDIYDVIESFMEAKWSEIKSAFPNQPETVVFGFISAFIEYKGVWRNLYRAKGHTEFSKYINKVTREFLTDIISTRLDISSLDPKDLNAVYVFYGEAFLGIIVRWLYDSEYKSEESIIDSLERIKRVFDGQLELLLENLSRGCELH